MDVGDYAIPCATDWNGDGRKDLIVGYRYADKLALFLNSGTDAQPVFTSWSNLQVAGADIYVAGSGCGAPAPWVCDYDADGKRDLLVGSGADGRVHFFRNTNSDAQPVLAAGVPLKVGAADLSVSSRATPHVHDWDEDGRNDLLCGAGDGLVYLFRNVGTPQAPAYPAAVQLQAGGLALNLGIRSVVRVFDWDGDGRKDLVASSTAGVYWCRNTGSNSAPVLQAAVALRSPVSGSGLVPINTGPRMRLDLSDWNNDGVIDLLLGNADGRVFLYEGYRLAFSESRCLAGGMISLRWDSADYLKFHVLAGPTLTNIQSIVATNLPSEGQTTCWSNSIIGGQQFYRVQIAP